MNIQKLLKKIDYKNRDDKKQSLTPQSTYKLITSESMESVNSITNDLNHNQLSIINPLTPQNINHNNIAIYTQSKLDTKLSQIDIMKHQYQNKDLKPKTKNKSIQQNYSKLNTAQKSQKHLLKPSNTPSFTKSQKNKKDKKNQNFNDPPFRKIYAENIRDICQPQNYNQKTVNKKIIYQHCSESHFQVEDQEQQPYEQCPYYSEQTRTKIVNSSQQDQCQMKNVIKTENDEKQILVNQNHEKTASDGGKGKCQCNCVTKEQIGLLFGDFSDKLTKLAERVSQLEKQNNNLQKNNKYLKLEVKQHCQDKQTVLAELKKETEEKEQLQMLLKDVLYKREREKLQNSKQHTHRQNDKKLTNVTLNNNNNNKSAVQLKLSPSMVKPPQNKMKIQNLLNKLQIKVDRV